MKLIDMNKSQIALVVDENNKLLGTLTDGDIRRGFLKDEKFDCSVNNLMNKDFKYINEGTNSKEALELMKMEQIYQIPVINNKGIVVDLLLLSEFLDKDKFDNTVVIMAGGKGMRLRPLTENCPKTGKLKSFPL